MRALTLLLCLGACAAQPSVVLCPPLRTYSAVQQKALAAELPHDGPMAQRFIIDYVALRSAVRACSAPH